jgi:hypothetical protein
VRRNYPYRGAADGLTTSLRRKLNTPRYLGIEIEVNAGMLRETGIRLAQLHRGLSASLVRACDEFSA